MTPAEISIATTRLLADVQALAKNVSDAVSSSGIEDRQIAWRNSADSLGSVISDVATLAKNDSWWAAAIGGTSSIDALKVSYEKLFEHTQRPATSTT